MSRRAAHSAARSGRLPRAWHAANSTAQDAAPSRAWRSASLPRRYRQRRCDAARRSRCRRETRLWAGPEAHEMHAVLAGPGRADGIGGAVPERGMRLLQRPQCDRDVFVLIMFARIVEQVGGQAGADAVERIDEDVARIVVLDLVIFELERRHAPAHAHL